VKRCGLQLDRIVFRGMMNVARAKRGIPMAGAADEGDRLRRIAERLQESQVLAAGMSPVWSSCSGRDRLGFDYLHRAIAQRDRDCT